MTKTKTEKQTKTSPFVFVDAVSETKRDVVRARELRIEDYVPFIVNRALSYHPDAVLYVNEMNALPDLPKIMQYDFYMETLRPRKRWAKWHKPETGEAERALTVLYGYSAARAREAIAVLRDDDVRMLAQQLRGID